MVLLLFLQILFYENTITHLRSFRLRFVYQHIKPSSILANFIQKNALSAVFLK